MLCSNHTRSKPASSSSADNDKSIYRIIHDYKLL
jgi:hypothetical protein